MFALPQTTLCPWIGPPTQYTHRYIYIAGPNTPTDDIVNNIRLIQILICILRV